jgi:hypothetical protein
MKKIVIKVVAVLFVMAITFACGTGHVTCDAYGCNDTVEKDVA